MNNTTTHTFTTNRKGLVWLVLITIAMIFASGVVGWLIIFNGETVFRSEKVAYIYVLLAILGWAVFALYCDWRTYFYACESSLTIDMQTDTLTYTYRNKRITFKSSDVEHWYWNTGLYLSRVAAHHSVIVLKSEEELPVYMWLFEGNRFLMSNDENYNTHNASYFIAVYRHVLSFPQQEKAPYCRYLFPPD